MTHTLDSSTGFYISSNQDELPALAADYYRYIGTGFTRCILFLLALLFAKSASAQTYHIENLAGR